jgi:hypothetical protein
MAWTPLASILCFAVIVVMAYMAGGDLIGELLRLF